MSEKITPIDAPDLVRRVTVTGFVDTHGRFWGEDERMARWSSCTHVRCQCGGLAERHWTACPDCRAKKAAERYAAMPKVEWNGGSFVYSDSHDRYFQDYDELVDYIRDLRADDSSVTVDDLRLIICEPNMAREIDGGDHFGDDLPEDGELPDELQQAIDALNAVIRKQPPLSWSPGKQAAIVTIAAADLADTA